MALHTELPIHRTGVRLLDLAIKAQVQMPRTVKRALGEKITQHCVDMLDLMALANATQRDTRAELALVPAHKSLFNAPPDHGLPIGNLSSQFFANVLLDDLDQFIKHRLRAPHYVRYVDDFILLHHSPQWLNQARAQIEEQLAGLHLQLNPRKTILQPVARGIDFVGHLLKPHRRITRRRTVRAALARLQDMPREDLHQSANSTFGLLRQATHSHQDRALLGQLMRRRGLVVAGDMSKVFQPKGQPCTPNS